MATEAETNEPMSETVDINDAVNAIENSFGGKQENKSNQPRKGTNSEKDSEVKVETETEAAAKHAMDTSEKTTANKTPYKDITDLTEAHIEEKGNKFQDETVNDKLEEEKREAKNGNLKDESVNYSILDAKQSEKGSTDGPTEINTSSIPKGETIEKEKENPEEAIEGKEVETQAGENIMQEVESISTAEPTVMEQNPDTNVLACQETEYDKQNKDDETRRGGDDTNINIGVSQSPLILQETHDHEDVSRTKNEKEIGETINHQGSTEENVQTEQTDTDNREFDIEAVEIVKEYHKEMSEEKEALIQEQFESDIGETEIDEVKYAKSHSIETSRINLDGDVGENDCRLKSEDKFDSFDVHETAKEEEERVPSEDIKESILESSSTTMEETAVKQDEEKIDESKDIPTLIKTTQVEYVQENGTNSSYDDQTNASISLSNGLSQDEQKDNQDEFTSLKIGNEIQTEPKLCETDDTTETSGANSFKDKESIDRDTENSIDNQLQQSPSDVYLDSLTTELEVETEGKNPIDETIKEDISNASIGAPSIFAVEVSQDQVEGINAMDTEDEENVDKSKDIPTLTKTTQAGYDDQTDASISLINGLGQDEQKDKKDEFTSLKIGHEMQTEQKLYETHDTIETGSANSSKDMESMERETVNSAENPLQQNSSDVYLDSLNDELEIEAEGEIPINEIVKKDTSNASTGAPSLFTAEVSRDQGEESNATNTKARDIGLATLDEAVNDKLEEEKIEAKKGNLKDENGNYSISNAKQSEKGSTNGPTEINTSKRETIEKEEEKLEEAIEEKEVETQAGDNKMQEVESISIAEPTELEQNPDTSVLACQEMEDDNQNKDDETERGGDDSNINIGVSQSPLILQETHNHEDVSRTKNEREIDETINYHGTTEENVQTEKTDTDDRELDIEAVEIDKEYHKKISEGKVLIQDRVGSDIVEVNNAKGCSIETSIINLDGDVGEKDCQLKSDDKFERFGVYEIAKEEKERMPSEDTEEIILESSSTTMEETAVKEDEENIKESKDIPTSTKTTQVENVQENGTNSSYDDQTNASISLSNGLSQDEQKDEQDEFTSLKIGNEIQIEPKLCRTDDTTETSGAYSFKDKESMERDTENSVENQLQQISSDVYLDSLTTELEIETEGEITINETDKEDTANASTEVPSNFAVEVSQDQVEGINAIDTKDEENIDESKDIQTLTKTTQVEYDDPTDASIGLINGLSQDEQTDKQCEFTSLKIGHKMQTEPKLYETDDTIETSSANSFKDEESMERNTVNSVEEHEQHNSLDVFVDSSNAELEIDTEGDIPINETVKDVISNASTGAPSIFAVEVSQDQGEESNGIDTKARDIGLATLDETLSSNKALQEKDMRGDHEYKEEKLETKLLQEKLEDKSINKETGTGAEQEFYEASETMEIRETEDFKESVAPERNVEKETLDGPHFHENVTEAEDTHVNEMEKETLKAKKDKESKDEDSKDIVSNISENSNLHESPALIIYDMEGADIQIADDLIQKPEKEEADNVMAQTDIDESLVVEEKIKSTSIDTSVKARTASENECKEKNEIIASSESNKLEEEQLAIQHITVAKQELFNTSNANKMEEDEGFKDKESIEEDISEKEILEHTEHEKSPLVILEDLETTTEAKGIQDTEFENQGIENEDNGKKIEASVPNNTEAIPSDSILKDDTECLAKRLPEKEEAINITNEEDNLLVSQLPNEAADSNTYLKIASESEKNRYISANVEKEKFEDAAIEKENDKPELAQPHVENEVSESDEIIMEKENEIAEKENCSTNVEPIIESEPRNRSCSSITVTIGGHPSEEEYQIEAVAAEDDRLQEQMNEKKEEKDDTNEELKDYKVEPNIDIKTTEEREEDRSTDENNNTENIITEELDVYPKLQEEQKEEQHIENEMLAKKPTYESCDVSESNENKRNKEKETADNILTFERTNKTENIPEVTSITENVIKEEEDFHIRLQEEDQNESLHMENKKLVESTTCESSDASESNENESAKEKERAENDIVNPEGPEITTEDGNIHEREITDIHAYNEDNPPSSEYIISDTDIDPNDQNTNSIQTTDSELSEKDREFELAPKINTETPCDTMDATYASLDKIMLNDSEAAEDKIHSKVDVMHVSENDEEKKEAHSSLQNKELEGETHTEEELYEGSKSSEAYENEVFGNNENAENIDPKEDNSEGKESYILSPHVPLVNSDVLAETKDCNHIKPEKQESITIHEANFNKEEENVIVEETNFEPQHVNQHEDTMEEEDTTPEHLSHQMAEKEAIITTYQETSTERKSSNEKGLEEKDISEYKIADKNDNVNEIETEKQYTHIDDEHNLQKGENIMLIKSTMETEPGNESTDSTHAIDRETHTEKVDNVVVASLEKNTQNAPEVIEDAIQNSCVELEDSDNNDKEKEEINIISPNKEKVIKPLETANARKLGYNEINNEEDTQKGEHMHAELAVCSKPAIQISNSVNENDEGQLVQKDDKAYREQGAIGKVEVEDLMTKYGDTEILHDNALQTLSLEPEEKVPSADIQVNAISKNENKDSKTKESEAEIDLKGLEVATKNQTIHGSEIKNQDATDNNETSDVELDAENQDNESIHTRLEAVITSEEVKDVDLVSQDDTKTVQVEENIYCTQEENGEAPVNMEKENKENRDNTASLRKEDFDKYPREELDGNPVDREEENEKLQAEQICLKSCNSSNIHDNESFPEKESVSEEEMNDQKPESFSILVPDDLNATLKSNTEKETMEFNDEKDIRKEEDTMLVESAITEESGNESNMLVSGTDRASAFEEAIEDELASQNDVQMTHANALNGKEDPLHKNIENDHRVLYEKIISAASEGHENKSSIERNLIVEESAEIAKVNQEKDQDEEHIEESEMDQSDGKVEQNESTVKTGIENTGINTALSKDDMIETAHAELLNGGVGVVPVDRVDENNDRLTEQSKMLSNDTGMETDDSFSKISNYWPINCSNEALSVNKMETLKLDEKTESSLQPVHDEDMLQEQSLQEPELNQSEQVKETEQLIGTKASVEVENDNLQEENLPFSQFLMKHILMNENDSVKTSYDDKIVDISKQDNDKQEDGIDMSKEEEVLVPSSSAENIHHASIVDDGAGFHEKHQENMEVQVDDKCDDSEVTNNQREMLTAELPIPVLEKTQYTSMVEDEAIDENPQEINKVQVAEDCDVKYNRVGNFPMELPISATEQTQHTSIVEDKTINENAEKNTEIQVDDECDVKNNPEFTDNIEETFTMQSPITVIEQTQYTSMPEHKGIEKPRVTDKVQLDDKCDVNDDSKVLDDKKEFSAVGLPITVDSTMMEHKFDARIHNEEFMQNDVDTQRNGKPNDNVVAQKLLNSYDPVQAEKSYGVTSDSETNFVKSDEKEENISNTLSEKSISAVKDKEDIHLISTGREIKEDNPNLLMDEQIFEKTLDDTITEKKILHKKECNALKVENSEIIEEEKGKRMLKNGLEDEIAVAGLQKDQQSNIAVEPEAALKENNLECNQDMHKYEKENEKEQNKFEAPPLSEGKANSEIKPVDNVEDNQDIHNQKNDSTEELSLSESQKAQEVDENNTDDDEDENHEVDEHKGNVSIPDQTINVESRDTEVTPTKRKSHGILSGVGSKVKRSIIKVKKAITGKSSHSEKQSAK